MEYVFGIRDNIEVLKTKGKEHSNLNGYCQIERKYSNQTITDNFRVVYKMNSKEDVEGNCYDWYCIDNHYRMEDKTELLNDSMVKIEDALCEIDARNEAVIANIEQALCDLDIGVNGGGQNE